MIPPTRPGQACRVIGGRTPYNKEGESPNIGKVVTTLFKHTEQAGIEQENVWRCSGDNLQTYYGDGSEADFLECWLELIEPLPTKLQTVESETLKVT